MRRLNIIVGGLALGGLLLGLTAPVRAEEARPSVKAQLLLNMFALPMDNPSATFKESLRAVPTAPGPGWEMLPDGSARFGTPNLYVIVRNPCPGHGPVAFPTR